MNKIAFNLLGLINIPAITLNIKSWMLDGNSDVIFTAIISTLAIIWWIMKIYSQYITIKKKKD